MKYDYLIVGAGMFGAVFARCVAQHGRRCLVIERRQNIGGNCYTESVEGVQVHRYGAHIFHTDCERVWSFVTRFSKFDPYVHRVSVRYKDRQFSFPINLRTFEQIWGVASEREVRARLNEVRRRSERGGSAKSWLLSQVGTEIYEIFFEGYTWKQWGRDPEDLPASIVKRIPIRFDHDERYFRDSFQGIPRGGYTQWFHAVLDHPRIETIIGTDYLRSRTRFDRLGRNVVYSGPIDEFFSFRYGALEYRSVRFEDELIRGGGQECAVVNYTERKVPFTRVIEHKYLNSAPALDGPSILSREYPVEWTQGREPYYPIRSKKNLRLLEQYTGLARSCGVLFGGRLGTFRYFDMNHVVGQAMAAAAQSLGSRSAGRGML